MNEPTHNDASQALQLAIEHHRAGNLDAAVSAYRAVLSIQPGHASANHNLGVVLSQTGRFSPALGHFLAAVEGAPAIAQHWLSLIDCMLHLAMWSEAASLLQTVRSQGLEHEALADFQQRIDAASTSARPNPTETAAAINGPSTQKAGAQLSETKPKTSLSGKKSMQGVEASGKHSPLETLSKQDRAKLVTLFNSGRFDEVERKAKKLLQIHPASGFAWKCYGAALQAQGKEAVHALEKATLLLPSSAEAHNNLAHALRLNHRLAEAERAALNALALQPDYADAYCTLGAIQRDFGRPTEAAHSFQRAVDLRPDYAEALCNLGTIQTDFGMLTEAIANCQRALKAKPRFAEACSKLGSAYLALGQHDEAWANYVRCYSLRPDSLQLALDAKLFLPIIYQSAQEAETFLAQFLRGIADLQSAEPLGINTAFPNYSPFYLAYQTANHRFAMEALCQLFRRHMPELSNTSAHITHWTPPSSRKERIRIGFLSEYLVTHTIGKLYQGLICTLDRSKFEVFVIHTSAAKQDDISKFIGEHADKVITLPSLLREQHAAIMAAKLDILFFPDIGMAPSTYFLAFARLAKLQMVSWGHPLTTGLDTMDYFVSSSLIEPNDAASHYTERLVCLNRLPSFYQPWIPEAAATNRAEFGLPPNGALYGCPQSLFKLHPDFDEILASIAARDPEGHIVLLEGRHPSWAAQLKKRWATTAPILNERVVFLPRLAQSRFMALLTHMDVLLDPIHFGSGNTLYEAMVLGIPIITWAGRFARGRIVAGAYHQMGIVDAPVAPRMEDYAPLAVAMAHDQGRRAALRTALVTGAKAALFTDLQAVTEFESFLLAALAAAEHAERLPSGWPVCVDSTRPSEGARV